MRKKTALITGGAGFIGSHLCQRLLNEGYKVICVDNFMTGSLDNIKELRGNKNFTLLVHNVCQEINISGSVDYVLHCASLASPEDYLKFPIQTLKVGSLGTHNFLGLAKSKEAVFILFSTSEVYGDPLVHPQKESYWGNVNPIGVRGCYDESKRFAEAITMAYHRVHKLDTKIVRIFNTYGPKMRRHDGRVVPNFIVQALDNKPLTVYGKGRQTRSFCYIDDLVDGIYRLMLSKINEPVNLGNPDEFTIMQLARLTLKLTNSKSKIVYKELPSDDPYQRKPDITRAKKALKWNPKIALRDGLRITIVWFLKNAKRER
ncbi:MAG: NAD-dependent dehydratase [Candidatus Omnitrophica bacterium CG23_combo_of_CG06-09_8_20_14_all_41_10]|uniref:NAD-dependent dehydratase n=1 Tax=Candidatus Sherwoodlollariibacterium unditelluris TaxID=1974757 RepID=A0A2G9YJV4_9BACT|nr:MAG: NAD-dependent dehydratase [Candidatus Omnitrophica bacterium CG23_combo_of_CG06-09_8_20_14_all_41_10]